MNRERKREDDREKKKERLDMYCWGGAGRDSKRHSTAQRTAAQGAE